MAAATRAGDDRSMLENRPPTVSRMFLERVEQTPDREAYRYPTGSGWRSVTWAQTGERARLLAAGLIALGVEPEQRVAIASGTRYEWILADLAVMCAGAATTTVYPTTIAEDVAYILADSESRVVFAEDGAQIAKLRERREEMPSIVKVIAFEGPSDSASEGHSAQAAGGSSDSASGDGWVISLAELEKLGHELLGRSPKAVEDRVRGTRPDSLATLIYTSGTTGRPKGVRLRHSSWTYEGAAVAAQRFLRIDDLQYLWLPLAHSFGKVLLATQLQIGFATAIDGRVEKIIENLAVVKPTFMGAAPRIFEKAHGRITTMADAGGRAKAAIFSWAFRVGLEVSRRRRAGEPVPALLRLRHRIADKLVFSKIRERFGGRLRFFVSGAAALSKELAEWFHAAGILILEGYGLTETSAGTFVNHPDNFKFGAVGLVFDGSEVKIAADGEVLIKGPGVMDGYHHREEQTKETLTDDGWFHTGDIGELDSDGFLRITDRKKDLFKTSGGKYIAPQSIEGQFKAVCPYASQIVVHGLDRNYCTALITLDPDAIAQWAQGHGMAGRPYAEIVTSPRVHRMVEGYVAQLNERLNRWETVKKFVILEQDLSVEAGEITPSLKVKRKVVEDKYRDRLDALYT